MSSPDALLLARVQVSPWSTRPLGKCGVRQLEQAFRLAVKDAKRMVLRDAPARLYGRTVSTGALLYALAEELRAAEVSRVELLSEQDREHAVWRAEQLAEEKLAQEVVG